MTNCAEGLTLSQDRFHVRSAPEGGSSRSFFTFFLLRVESGAYSVHSVSTRSRRKFETTAWPIRFFVLVSRNFVETI